MGKWGGVMEILKFIRFKDMNDFSVKSYFTNTIQSKFNIISLQKFIIEQNQKVKPFDFPEQDFPILGVDNKVGIFDAYIQKGKEINQPYKIMKNDFLAYNPYRINVGSIGLKKENHKHQYISPAYVVFSCLEELYSEYLFLLFKTNTFNKIINESTTGSVRQNLSFNILSNIKIPLPDIDIQKSLVSAYQEKIKQAEILENQARQIDIEIEQYLFDSLGVQIKQTQKKEKGVLNFVNFKNLEKWLFNDTELDFFNQLYKSQYEVKPLGQCVNFIVRSWKKEEKEKQYIEIGSIDSDFGILETKTIYSKKPPSRATQLVKSGDLIIGTTRPYLKKFVIIQDEFDDFVASSGFSVIQENSKQYNLEYIDYILRSKIGIRQFEIKMTGALYPAITQTELEEIKIPFPEIEVQNQIANHIQALKAQQKQAKTQAKILREQAIEEFEKAVFE